ncbi:MAG: MGMT family protein [Desulfosalsimonadaceae bacterium]
MNSQKLKTAWVDTQVGRLTLVYEDAPLLVKRILLPGEEKYPSDQCLSFADEGRPVSVELSRMVIDHLNGARTQPPWDILSREGITPLQQAVYVQTAAIPYASLASYGEIAERIGRPKACRFVGSALAKNPFPILIPCHRVIRSDNKLGGFGGGLALKQLLIDFEARRA